MRPLAVSMGDPAGIGLELAARVAADRRGAPPFFLVGDGDALARAAKRIGLSEPAIRVIQSGADIDAGAEALAVLNTALAVEETPGSPDPVNAEATIAAIKTGVAAVRAG